MRGHTQIEMPLSIRTESSRLYVIISISRRSEYQFEELNTFLILYTHWISEERAVMVTTSHTTYKPLTSLHDLDNMWNIGRHYDIKQHSYSVPIHFCFSKEQMGVVENMNPLRPSNTTIQVLIFSVAAKYCGRITSDVNSEALTQHYWRKLDKKNKKLAIADSIQCATDSSSPEE